MAGPARIVLTASYVIGRCGQRSSPAGRCGYVTKAQTSDVLIAALRSAAPRVGRFIDPGARRAGRRSPRHQPSGRCRHAKYDVMFAFAKGERIADIADDLCLSPKTVSTHRRRILDKLGLRSNVELAAYAADRGMVER